MFIGYEGAPPVYAAMLPALPNSDSVAPARAVGGAALKTAGMVAALLLHRKLGSMGMPGHAGFGGVRPETTGSLDRKWARIRRALEEGVMPSPADLDEFYRSLEELISDSPGGWDPPHEPPFGYPYP